MISTVQKNHDGSGSYAIPIQKAAEKPLLKKVAYIACLAFMAIGAMAAITSLALATLILPTVCFSVAGGSMLIGAAAYFLKDLFK